MRGLLDSASRINSKLCSFKLECAHSLICYGTTWQLKNISCSLLDSRELNQKSNKRRLTPLLQRCCFRSSEISLSRIWVAAWRDASLLQSLLFRIQKLSTWTSLQLVWILRTEDNCGTFWVLRRASAQLFWPHIQWRKLMCYAIVLESWRMESCVALRLKFAWNPFMAVAITCS
jgi:hypothetical protein